METNPYESPSFPDDPPASSAADAFWRDTLSLLFWGAVLYVPTALLCVLVFSIFINPPHSLIILLVLLCFFLVARVYSRVRTCGQREIDRRR
jgi:hypothetical protein